MYFFVLFEAWWPMNFFYCMEKSSSDINLNISFRLGQMGLEQHEDELLYQDQSLTFVSFTWCAIKRWSLLVKEEVNWAWL